MTRLHAEQPMTASRFVTRLLTLWVVLALGALGAGAQLVEIVSEDFSGPGLPAGWTSVDTSGNNRLWSWCADPTNVTPAPAGSTTGCHRVWDDGLNAQVPFAATTANNGFVTVDSDASANVTHVSELTVGPIAIPTPQAKVLAEFETHIGVFSLDPTDNALLRASTDGVNWTPFTVFPGLDTGAPNPPTERWSFNPEAKSIDISSVAGGQPAVYLQWQWTANYEYHWDIDDFRLVAGEFPEIGVAKAASSPTASGPGTFDSTVTLTVENLSASPLTNVQVTDDLTASFPAPATFSVISGPAASGALTANGSFDGSGDTALLVAGSSTLAPGAVETITFTVRFDPNGLPGPFFNSAVATAAGSFASTDTSDDGTDPDPNGNGNPDEAGEDDPTPLALPAAPLIGVAKAASPAIDAGGGAFDVTLTLAVENFAAEALSSVQVVDDLTATFPAPATFAVISAPMATGSLTANAGFDGSGDTDLLVAASSTLPVGAAETITFTVRFDPGSLPGPFFNSATASANDVSGLPSFDTSDDGADPDPNGNGNPNEFGENDPTPISVPEQPSVNVSKTMTAAAAVAPTDVVIDLSIENTGNVTLINLSLVEDLATVFGPTPTNWTLTSVAEISGPATFDVEPSFTGVAPNTELIAAGSALEPGEVGVIQIVLRLEEAGAYVNVAAATGASPAGTIVTSEGRDDVAVGGTIEIPTLGGLGILLLAGMLAWVAATRLGRT